MASYLLNFLVRNMEKAVKPLISIIIPAYNVEKYIDRCIESIVSQTYNNIEVIVVDDGSTDKTLDKLNEWSKKDSRIKIIPKKNGGVSSARNVGLDKATGEYVSFVDSDDFIADTYCEDMLNTLLSNNADYISCGYNRVYQDGHFETFNADNELKIIDSKEYFNNVLDVIPGYGFVHMKMVRRDLIGDIRFNEKLKAGEDALFNAELCDKIGKIVIYNKPLYNYYFNENSIVRKYDENYVQKYFDSMEAMFNYASKKDDSNRVYNYIAFHILLICVNYCYHPNNKDQMKSLKEVCNIPLFKEAIKKAQADNWSKVRKITLFTLKHRLYFMTSMICKYRQSQFKRKA